ncbi:hypothetical protein BJX64DRAFT_294919 [Aspergillus heterothallicus]
MSDPFSVTGSAVGVASLGLTICQGFLAYYGPYKSFHDDINEIVSRIQSLSALLVMLQRVITESSASNAWPSTSLATSPVTQQVHLATQNIDSCKKGLKQLEKMLEKCHRICPPGREKASRLRNKFDRLLYPFRRETLVKLMDTVAWLQANVDTALQILQMSMLNSGQQSMGLVLSHAMSTASNTDKLVGGIERLEDQHSGIHSTLTILLQRIDQVESHIKANSGQPITKPDLLRSLADTQRENDTSLNILLPSLQSRTRLTKRTLRCNCNPKKVHSTNHGPCCPLHNQNRNLVSLMFRHTFCNWFLRFSVTASLTMTKGAGGFSISPNLQFRAVVPDDSPAFKLLTKHSRFHTWDPLLIKRSEIRSTHRKLFDLFHAGLASPTDTLENGTTILHAVAKWQKWNWSWDDDAWADWHAFIDDLLATEISPSALNHEGMTPIDVVIHSNDEFRFKQSGEARPSHTVNFCLQLLKEGSYITNQAFPMKHTCVFEAYKDHYYFFRSYAIRIPMSARATRLLQSVIAKHGMYDVEIPNELIPLLSESVNGLRSLLQSIGNKQSDYSLYFDYYAEWPTGLAILLDHGFVPTLATLYRAIETTCTPCVQLILDCERFEMGNGALIFASEERICTPQIRRLVVEALAKRRRRLQALAEKRLPPTLKAKLNIRHGTLLNRSAAWASALLKTCSVDVGGLEAMGSHCVYFAQRGNLDFWNELWDAGFRDVDEPDEDGYTILRACCNSYSGYHNLPELLQQIEWLISRGADLYRICRDTPAIHELGDRLAIMMAGTEVSSLSGMSEQCTKLLHDVLIDDVRDNCKCACCPGGCFAFKRLLHRIFGRLQRLDDPVWMVEVYGPPLSVVFDVIESTLGDKPGGDFFHTIAPWIIRYLTFCELDLTHTCTHDAKDQDPEAIGEIHAEEASLIAQLDLVVEELLEIYRRSPLSLHEFLRDVWRDRMDDILSEMPNNQEASDLRRVGVTIEVDKREVSWADLLSGPRFYYPPSWLFSDPAL